MSEKILIVCDAEVTYVKRLIERMIKEGAFNYKLQVFDSLSAVLDYSKVTPVSVLILGEKLLEEDGEEKSIRAGLKESGIADIYLLSEKNADLDKKEYPAFYKYQASSVLMRQFKEALGKRSAGKESLDFSKDVIMVGFFSPHGSVGKTMFASVAGQLIARQKGTLYINLERYSGFEALFGKNAERNLTEAIFYLLREDEVPAEVVGEMFEEYEGLWYLPPISKAGEFEGIKSETLPKCLRKLKMILQEAKLQQKLVILEFSGATQGYMELLGFCDKVYITEEEDLISRRALEEFYAECNIYDGDIMERVRRIKLPVVKEAPGDEFLKTSAGREFERAVQLKLREEGLLEGGVKKQAY